MAVLGDMTTCLSTVAIFLNSLLLPLIAFKSGRDIGSYKVLLFLYSLVAIVHTTVTLILVPVSFSLSLSLLVSPFLFFYCTFFQVFEPSEKGWLFYATVPRVGRELGSWLFCIFATCYIKLLLILTYSFVYRYFVMCA